MATAKNTGSNVMERLKIIEINLGSSKPGKTSVSSWTRMRFRASTVKRLEMYEKIAEFLKDKLPLEETLAIISKRYLMDKDYRGHIVANWRKEISMGKKFSDAIKKDVPAAEVMMISLGETGDSGIQDGLDEAIRLTRASADIKAAIKKEMVEPVVLILMLIAMLYIFRNKLTPAFESMLPVEQWDSASQMLRVTADFVFGYWYILSAIVVAAGYLLAKTLPNWKDSANRRFADKLPGFSLFRSYHSSVFMIALSSMMKSTVSLNDALQKIKENSNDWVKSHIMIMQRRLRVSGSDFGKALNTGLLLKEVAGDIEDYSNLSSFENAIYKIGEKSMKKAVGDIKTKMIGLKMVLKLIVAFMVLFIYGTSINLSMTAGDKASSPQAISAMKV